MGGGISLRFAQDYPDVVSLLTLIGSLVRWSRRASSSCSLSIAARTRSSSTAPRIRAPSTLRRRARAPLPAHDPAGRRRPSCAARRHLPSSAAGPTPLLVRGYRPRPIDDHGTDARDLHGDRDRVIHLQRQAALAEQIPNARLEALRSRPRSSDGSALENGSIHRIVRRRRRGAPRDGGARPAIRQAATR